MTELWDCLWSVFEMFGMIWRQFSVCLKSSFLPRLIYPSISAVFYFQMTATSCLISRLCCLSKPRVANLHHTCTHFDSVNLHRHLNIPTHTHTHSGDWSASQVNSILPISFFKECHNTVVQLLHNTENHWCGVRSMEPQRKPQAFPMSMYFNDMPLSKYWIYIICCVESTLR